MQQPTVLFFVGYFFGALITFQASLIGFKALTLGFYSVEGRLGDTLQSATLPFNLNNLLSTLAQSTDQAL